MYVRMFGVRKLVNVCRLQRLAGFAISTYIQSPYNNACMYVCMY